MQVVLPDPFGPTRPSTSPGAIDSERPSSARKPPNRLTRLPMARSGALSGDIDAPPLQQGREPVGQEQNQRHDQEAIDQLEILRCRHTNHVVDAVENDDADDRAEQRRRAAEQREDDRENREFGAEHGLRKEYGDIPSEDAAGEA